MNKNENRIAGRVRFLRFIAIVCVLYGGFRLLRLLWAKFLILILRIQSAASVSEAATIGIIGGADGPTAIFVTAPNLVLGWIPALFLLVGTGLLIAIRKKKIK